MARKRDRKSVRGKARRSKQRGSATRKSGARASAAGRHSSARARPKAPIGVLLWTAIILFVLVVFLFNRVAIRDVMDRTDLLTVLRRSVGNAVGRNSPAAVAVPLPQVTRSPLPSAATGDGVPQPEAPRETQPQVVSQPQAVSQPPAVSQPRIAAADPAPGREDALPAAAPTPPDDAPPPEAETTSANAPAPPDASPPPLVPSVRQRRLFFAAVSDAGEIAVTGVMRAVDDTASPLTETLRTLFAGPEPSEVNQGLVTMIPPAVTLHRVYVSERIAYIDVSESFRFNPLGREGLDAQLQQIVFSATEFPGVEMVQILIDGRRVEFLGPEGTYIGKPIGRARFFGTSPAAP